MPSRRSERPRPYQGAVSKKRTPESQAAATVHKLSSLDTAELPMVPPPNPSGLTRMSLLPTGRGVVASIDSTPTTQARLRRRLEGRSGVLRWARRDRR